VVSSYAALAALDEGGEYAARLPDVVARLRGKALPVGGEIAFAYEFNMQTRWGYYPAGRPNAVATAFGAHALLDAAAALPDPALAEMAHAALRYATSALVVEAGHERFFGYYEGKGTPIHNSSMLLVGLAARCAEEGTAEWRAAEDALAYTLERQRPDGSWPYGEEAGLGWVDGFHTAYILRNLALWHERTGDERAARALDKGLDLYVTRLVDADGAARHTLDSRYPIDIHACATAISSLSALAAHHPQARATATRVLGWTLRNMSRGDGRFAFQQHKRYRNSIPYIRWGDSHMLYGLASYLTEEDHDDAR
jgi:hypothetical protein